MKDLNNILALTRGHNLHMADKVDLIASNSCISNFARLVMSSTLTNNYCIGFPGARLYGGCTFIDMIEREVHGLVRKVFGDINHVVVQFLSGMQANIGAYNAVLKPGDTILAACEAHGGHYSHTIKGPLKLFSPNIVELPFDDGAYNIDVNGLEDVMRKHKPKLMILGWSEFLFPHPLKDVRTLCDKYHVKLMYDMSHVVGLIAGGVFQPDAVKYADIITSSTGKSLHAPDHGLIMFHDDELAAGVNEAVMPLLTSNTHPQEVAGLGVALTEMMHFGHDYATQVVRNSKALAKALTDQGIKALYGDKGYSESHTVLVEHSKALKAVTLLDRAGVLLNACKLPWDDDEHTTGLRIGTQVVTRHGYKEEDMPKIADIISEVIIHNKVPEVLQFSKVHPLVKGHEKVFFSFDDSFPVSGDWHENIFKQYKAETSSAILRSSPAFAKCTLKEIDEIEPLFKMVEFKKDEKVFQANSESDSVYFIAHGSIKIIDESENTPKTIDILGENLHFGELGVLSKNKRKFTTLAEEDSKTLRIDAKDFHNILSQHQSIKDYFDRYIVSLSN